MSISDDHDVGYWSGLLKKRSQLILVHILGYLGAIVSVPGARGASKKNVSSMYTSQDANAAIASLVIRSLLVETIRSQS